MIALSLALLAAAGMALIVLRGRRLKRPGRLDRFQARIEAAGLRQLSLGSFILLALLGGVLAAALLMLISGVYALALLGFGAGAALPVMVVNYQHRRLRKLNTGVWPDMVENIVSGIRAGMGLPEAVCALRSFGPPHLRRVFHELAEDYYATGQFTSALLQAKDRLGDPRADRVLETIQLARNLGGSEVVRVLSNLADYLREEAAVRAEIISRQSWVINAARVGVAAPWVVLLLLSTRAQTALAYNSKLGLLIILLGAAACFIAYRIMMTIGRLPEEERYLK